MAGQSNGLIVASLASNASPEARYQLDVPSIRIGRSVSGPRDIRLPEDDLLASREHALLICENGTWFLEDRSRNGTRVNEQLIHRARVRLSSGDRIKIGHSFDVVFRSPSETTQSGEFSLTPLGPAALNNHPEPAPDVSVGLWLSSNGIVWRDGKPLPVVLSRTEYRLLRYLMQHANEICEYRLVLQAVWDVLNRWRISMNWFIGCGARSSQTPPARAICKFAPASAWCSSQPVRRPSRTKAKSPRAKSSHNHNDHRASPRFAIDDPAQRVGHPPTNGLLGSVLAELAQLAKHGLRHDLGQ